MCRKLSLPAEVIRGADNPLPEVTLPDPVDHHPCCERMVGARQPKSQTFAVASSTSLWQHFLRFRAIVQDCRYAGTHLALVSPKISSIQNVRLGNHLGVQMTKNRGGGQIEKTIEPHPV